MSDVREYIIERLQREYDFKDGIDIEKINYIEDGYMDSIGLIQFIGEIEDEFGIEFSDDEMGSQSFRIVGELIALVESKMEEKA